MFRKYTGKTYSEYLTELKLDYSKKLLLTTDLSITDICFSSGFSSVSNFLKAFKQKTDFLLTNSARKTIICKKSPCGAMSLSYHFVQFTLTKIFS